MAPKPDTPDLDELLKRIHLDVKARRAGTLAPAPASGAPMRAPIVRAATPGSAPAPPRWYHNGPAFTPADCSELGDLLAMHDEGFVDGAYSVELNRGSDATVRALTKPEFLGRLRYSPEGTDDAPDAVVACIADRAVLRAHDAICVKAPAPRECDRALTLVQEGRRRVDVEDPDAAVRKRVAIDPASRNA